MVFRAGEVQIAVWWWWWWRCCDREYGDDDDDDEHDDDDIQVRVKITTEKQVTLFCVLY